MLRANDTHTDGVDINRAGVDSLVQHSGEVVIQHTKQLSEVASGQGPVAGGLLVQRIFLKVVRTPVKARCCQKTAHGPKESIAALTFRIEPQRARFRRSVQKVEQQISPTRTCSP